MPRKPVNTAANKAMKPVTAGAGAAGKAASAAFSVAFSAALFCARMRLIVDMRQMLEIERGVHLGGGDAGDLLWSSGHRNS